MRPQSRPFVVEIKRSKKSPAASAEQAEAPRPKVSLFDTPPRSGESASAARQAAERLFGAVARQPEPAVAPADEPSFPVAVDSPPARRVWFAPDPVAAEAVAETVLATPAFEEPVFEEPALEQPVRVRRPRGRPKAVPLEAQPPSMLETPVPDPLPPPVEDDLAVEDDVVADAPRRAGGRIAGRRKDGLARGERWKRRLPTVCR
ncbi:MAG: hypothetical protein U1E62_05645 [Alsobacter sp.]